MKTFLRVVILIVGLGITATGLPPESRKFSSMENLNIDNQSYIDANSILMFVTNHGNFGRDLTDMFHQDAGTFYPFTSIDAIQDGSNNSTCNYASGLWIGGLVNGETRVTLAEYTDEYVPGFIENGTAVLDRPDFKVYKLHASYVNEDYLNWPYDQGAPWKWNEAGTERVPDMIGDQMLWSVYNDADAAKHTNDAGSTAPLGVEVRQTTWAYDGPGFALQNIIFLRYRIFNKGENTIEDCYFSLWDDPDLGGAGDDLVGCDTLRDLGFVYNATNNDSQYGSRPPSMGFDLLQGPLVSSPGDTARMWGQFYPDMKNSGMVSFVKYINGTDPNSASESYNYMKGLQSDGTPYSYQGNETPFMHSGNIIIEVGDLDSNPADRRFMISTGPITFRPGDSTELYAAIIVGQSSDRLSSFLTMKNDDNVAQALYDTLQWGNIPTAVNSSANVLPTSFSLDQNYPNPFNPTTRIGYTLSQGGEVSLIIYNALGQQVRELVNRFQSAGTHRVEWDARDNYGSEVAAGLYLYRIKVDHYQFSKKMLLIK